LHGLLFNPEDGGRHIRPKLRNSSKLHGVTTEIILIKLIVYLFATGFAYASCGGLGITAGAHRLWAHRSYKATWQLRIILGIFQTIAFQVYVSFQYSTQYSRCSK
jgi:fatty-acid desaturase